MIDDNQLSNLIKNLRTRVREYRSSCDCINGGTLSLFFVDVIEISSALAEIGLLRKRKISKEEHYWFEAAYHMNFELAGGQWEDVLKMYEQLVTEIRERNFFY